jgi:hypothetical protein
MENFKGGKGAAGFDDLVALSNGIVEQRVDDCEQFPITKK